MQKLFQVIAKRHSVSAEEVSRSLGRRPAAFDAFVILGFLLLYGWGAIMVAHWLCGLYAAQEAHATVVIMLVLASIFIGIAGIMLGEVWSSAWEMYRLGSGHMSYRTARLPWTHHRLSEFLAGMLFSIAVAAFRRRQATKRPRGDRLAAY